MLTHYIQGSRPPIGWECCVTNAITFRTHRAAAMTLRTVLLSIQALLQAAEPDDPQDAVVARQYKEDPELYRKTARHWAQVYAGGEFTAYLPFPSHVLHFLAFSYHTCIPIIFLLLFPFLFLLPSMNYLIILIYHIIYSTPLLSPPTPFPSLYCILHFSPKEF